MIVWFFQLNWCNEHVIMIVPHFATFFLQWLKGCSVISCLNDCMEGCLNIQAVQKLLKIRIFFGWLHFRSLLVCMYSEQCQYLYGITFCIKTYFTWDLICFETKIHPTTSECNAQCMFSLWLWCFRYDILWWFSLLIGCTWSVLLATYSKFSNSKRVYPKIENDRKSFYPLNNGQVNLLFALFSIWEKVKSLCDEWSDEAICSIC